MPAALKQHIRYPEDLFKIQSVMYGIYHMQDPVVFYNKEDAWDIPTEIYGEGREIRMEPYYIIMKLPEDEEAEFILMTPFTPLGKANMIGWMAAKSDKDYGALVVYKFPKESLIYGPLQIEARIDQDARISEQITLWDQRGSNVIRGNLLVIPIDHSILYIEPLYLIAEKAQLPELTRVIVSYGGKVVMEKDLATALQRLFKPEVPEKRVVDWRHSRRGTWLRAVRSLARAYEQWRGYYREICFCRLYCYYKECYLGSHNVRIGWRAFWYCACLQSLEVKTS